MLPNVFRCCSALNTTLDSDSEPYFDMSLVYLNILNVNVHKCSMARLTLVIIFIATKIMSTNLN